MAENSVAPVARGETFFKGGTADANGGGHLEGQVHVFPNTDPDDTTKRRNGGNVTAVLVRNGSSGALLPGIAVKWKASLQQGTSVDAFAGSGNAKARCAGVVDDHLPAAGVATNDIFWLVVKGQCKCTMDGNTAADAVVQVAPSDGHVKIHAGTAIEDALNVVGVNGTGAQINDNAIGIITVNILTNGI